MLKGVDVSGHQPDWEPVDSDAFVFVKCTEGSTYFSADSVEQLRKARAKGLQVGHYHFMVPGNATRQAAWFVSQADVQPGDLLACDWETHKEGHPSVEDRAEFRAEVKRLLPHHKEGLYCNTSDWLSTSVKAGDFLWIAHYTAMAEPGIASTWHFWQFSDTPIDLNKGHFDSLDSLKHWAGGGNYSIQYQAPYMGWKNTEEWITFKDLEILVAIENELRPWFGPIRIVQGGLSMGTQSAYTHAGLGAFDVSVKNPFTTENDYHSTETVLKAAAVFNRAGLLAFIRGYEIGGYDDKWDDDRHLHVVSWESYNSLHQQAKDQIKEYLAWLAGGPDGDGLTTSQQYPGPRIPNLEHWATSPYNPKNIKADTGVYEVNTDVLMGRDVDYTIVRRRARGYRIQITKQIYRWGRWNVATSTPTLYALDYLKKVA